MTRSAAELAAAGTEALVEAAFRTGDYTEADTLLTSAREQATDPVTEAAVLHQLGMLMHFQALDRGRDATLAADEEALFQQALRLRREAGDLAGVAESLFGVGLVHQVLRDDSATAIPYFREALPLADEHAGDLTRSEVHRHVGFYYALVDVQPDKALHHLRESLELRETFGDQRWLPSGTLALGEAELDLGDRDTALRLLRAAVAQAKQARLRPERIAMAEEALRDAETR